MRLFVSCGARMRTKDATEAQPRGRRRVGVEVESAQRRNTEGQ
jgi:hypothetical protein